MKFARLFRTKRPFALLDPARVLSILDWPARLGKLAEALLPHQVAEQAGRDRELRDREPRIGDLLHLQADATALLAARRDPVFARARPRCPVAAQGGGQPPLGV